MNDFDFGYDPYSDLPDDPEEAFLKLEAHFKSECERTLQSLGQNDRTDVVYVDYMAKVLGAINGLGLEGNFKSEVPSIDDVDYATYFEFQQRCNSLPNGIEDPTQSARAGLFRSVRRKRKKQNSSSSRSNTRTF